MEASENKRRKDNDGSIIGGIIMLSIGLIFLVRRMFPEIDFGYIWPFIFIIIGIVLLIKGFRN